MYLIDLDISLLRQAALRAKAEYGEDRTDTLASVSADKLLLLLAELVEYRNGNRKALR